MLLDAYFFVLAMPLNHLGKRKTELDGAKNCLGKTRILLDGAKNRLEIANFWLAVPLKLLYYKKYTSMASRTESMNLRTTSTVWQTNFRGILEFQ